MEERAAPLPGPADDLGHLLRPSLGPTVAPMRPLYSVRAGFLVAFFGGVYATLGFSALNTRRAGRLARDAWLYALAAVAWTGVLIAAGHALGTDGLPSWLGFAGTPQRGVRWVGRLTALALFGLVYLRHRALLKTQALVGTDAPNPWAAALLWVVLGAALSFAALTLGVALGRS